MPLPYGPVTAVVAYVCAAPAAAITLTGGSLAAGALGLTSLLG